MKQTLLKSWLMLVCLLVFGGGQSWAADVINNAATSDKLGSTATSAWVNAFDLTLSSGAVVNIKSMGTKSTSNALQWNANGYLYMKTSGGKLKSVTIKGASKTVNVYASNTAYSATPSGTALGTISVTSEGATYTFTSDYTYLALKGTASSTSITEITIEYANGGATPEPTKYNVTIANNIANGTVTANPTSAKEGDDITLTATPATGYEFGSWNVTDASSNSITVTGNKFTMPAANVNVSATFNEIQGGGEPSGDEYTHDVLTSSDLAATSTTYADFSNVSKNTAVYAGNSALNNGISLRTNNSNSGIVSTTSGGKIRTITVTWNSNTTSGRTIDIYGRNVAYEQANDLYVDATRGTKLGSIVCGTSTSFIVTGDYAYVGVRSNSNALMIDNIDFAWEEENTKSLSSIAVKTAPTKVTYTEEENFDPTGLVITATYDDKNTEDIAYSGNESKFTFNPALTEALTTSTTSVTITYKEKTATQAITVNAIPTYTLTITQPADGGVLTVKDGETALESGASVRVGTNLTCEVTGIPEGKRFSRFYAKWGEGDAESKYKTTNPATFDNIPAENITACEIYVTYKDIQYYTINYMINGVNTDPQENVEEKTALTFPTAPATLGDKSFVGWTETEITGIVEEEPTLVNNTSALTATANKTYYAVYASLSGQGDPNILTSVSGPISTGDYYLVDTYDGVDANGATAPRFWAVNGGLQNNTSGGLTSLDVSSYATEESGKLSLELTDVSDANRPTLYTITVTDGAVSISKGTETYYCTVGSNDVNADMKTSADGNINWNRIVEGTGDYAGRYSIEVDFPSNSDKKRCLLFQEHTASANTNRSFKNQSLTNRGAGGNDKKEASFSSGYFYFLQAGAATFSDFTTTPLGTEEVTISAVGWATYYTDKAFVMPEGVEGYIMKDNGTKVTSEKIYEAGDVVPAETAIMINGEAKKYNLVITNEEGTAATGNLLKGKLVSATTDGGSANAKYYKFANGEKGLGWYYGSKDNTTGAPFTTGAKKAYLVLNAENQYNAKGFVSIFNDDEEETTGIANVNAEKSNGLVYNLNGQLVNADAKGIVIINGRKYLKK